MIRYCRVTFKPEVEVIPGRPRTVTLEVIADGPAFLFAWECNRRTGDRGDLQHFIDKGTIARRVDLQMNPTYGELEPLAVNSTAG